MHNYYAFGQCFKEKRKDRLNSVAWDQCIHQKEFIDMTKVIEGDNPNLPLNEDTLLKLDTLLEDDDLVQNASDVLNSFIKKDNTEEEARNAFHFMKANNINPFGAKNTISNLASGVGKTMDSDEALGIYNKAEQGSNTIPNSHALQNFFERRKSSTNPELNNLVLGLGKDPSSEKVNDYLYNNQSNLGSKDADKDTSYRTLYKSTVLNDLKKIGESDPNSELQNIDLYAIENPSENETDPAGYHNRIISDHYREKYGQDPQAAVESFKNRYDLNFENRDELKNKKEGMISFFLDKNMTEEQLHEKYPQEMKEFEKITSRLNLYLGVDDMSDRYSSDKIDATRAKTEFLNIFNNARNVSNDEAGYAKVLEQLKESRPELYNTLIKNNITNPYRY